jgi:hypothetical protein
MGINIFVLETSFQINSKNVESALDAVKRLSVEMETIAFVNRETVINSSDIYTVLSEWRWHPVIDDENNIIDLEFWGEKLGNEEILFNKISSFVEDKSFIVAANDEGKIWRWRFDGENCHYEIGKIVF